MKWLLVVMAMFTSERAWACAACTTGDPTLTAFGSERPYAGRVRVAFDLRTRHEAIGEAGVDRVIVDEVRTEIGLAWAPTDALFLQLALPLLWRDVGYVDDARNTMVATGDIGLRAKLVLGWGIALAAGLSFPTAPVVETNGRRLPIEAQPGTGSVDPALGVSWSLSDRDVRPWAFGASAWGVWPTGDANPQLRLTTHGQRELWRDGEKAIALRLALEGRVDGRAYEGDTVVAHSGGFIGYVGVDVAIAPATDWQLDVGVRIPVINALNGAHDEGVLGTASLAWDLP